MTSIPTDSTSGLHLSTLSATVDVADYMRGVAANHPDSPPCWIMWDGTESLPLLMVALRGEVGALTWEDYEGSRRPVDGTNQAEVDYWLGGVHHTPMPPLTELPAHRVLEAVAEFVRTGQQPTAIQWTPLELPDTAADE